VNTTQADFEFVEAHKDEFPITMLTKITDHLSRTHYYKLLEGKKGPTREERDKPLLNKMLSLYINHGGNLGNERFKIELYEKYGDVVNVKKISRMRRMYNLHLKTKRRKPRKAGEVHHIVGNLLNRNFKAKKPGKKLCIDITYLKVIKPRENFLFLCAITDLYNNEIVAYSIGEDMTTGLVFKALDQLKEKGLVKKNTILHSDQGVQFTSPRYVNRLKEMKIIQSMSRRGNCWDNACIESFFGKLKTEMPGFSVPETRKEMIKAVTEYITYYNELRPQLKLKKSPIAYRMTEAA